MMNRVLVGMMVIVSVSGCNATKGLKYSIARGTGDVSATVYLDKTSDPASNRVLLNTVCDKALAWLDANAARSMVMPTAKSSSAYLKSGLYAQFPPQFQFIVDAIVKKFTGSIAVDVNIAKNLLVGVKTGANLYVR